MQNDAGTCPQDWHKSDTTGSGFVPEHTKENAATSAKVNGAKDLEKASNFHGDTTPKQRCCAMAEVGAPAHIRAVNMLGYALSLQTSDAWNGASAVWEARLTERERVALAFSVLSSLDEDTAYMTASAALFGTLGGEVLA